MTPPKKFQPGQFGCDILLTKRFPLHWRLQPNSALTILSNEVLRPFAVKNRPNMFVIMRDNVVVYCFLSEGVASHAMDSDSQNDNESLYLRPGSPCGGGYSLQQIESNGERSMTGGGEMSHSKLHTTSFSSFAGTASPHGSPHSERASTTSPTGRQQPINTSTSSNLSPSIKKPRYIESRELLFEVHGVEFGGWISELVEMLESRLMSQIIMKEVQQFLTRNPTSKLSRAVSKPLGEASTTNDSFYVPIGFGIHLTRWENALFTSHPSYHPCDLKPITLFGLVATKHSRGSFTGFGWYRYCLTGPTSPHDPVWIVLWWVVLVVSIHRGKQW